MKTPRRGLTQHPNREVSEESGTHIAWQTGDYAYEWYGNGMLKEVRLPYGKTVRFEYDALGRRTAKLFNGLVFRYLWDGNVMVQEWQYEEKDRPQHSIDEFARIRMQSEEPVDNLVTWVYEEGSYVPVAKLQNGERYTIISDYMGRPVDAYNSYGNVVWQADYDVYGDLRNIKGIRDFIPFRQLGQYEDDETRLYYNRFRYYDPRIGNYICQDPIRLAGNNPTLYGYVGDCNTLIDIWGLSECSKKTGYKSIVSNKDTVIQNKKIATDIVPYYPPNDGALGDIERVFLMPGQKVDRFGQADYDVYGDLRNIKGIRDFIPFRQLGQYEDDETRLYYNRFRYYDPRIGNYISQDLIRLVGNNPTLYGYVGDCNIELDALGLSIALPCPNGTNPWKEGETIYFIVVPKGGMDIDMAIDIDVYTKYGPGSWGTT